MPSKRSFFNRTLFRRNLSHSWPLWGGMQHLQRGGKHRGLAGLPDGLELDDVLLKVQRSFFNRTLFRRNLSHSWPLWGLLSAAGAMVPLYILLELLNKEAPADGQQAPQETGHGVGDEEHGQTGEGVGDEQAGTVHRQT